jgi:hypothetical protein
LRRIGNLVFSNNIIIDSYFYTNHHFLSNHLYKMPEQKSVAQPMGIDMGDLASRAIKYSLEGLAVAIAAYLLPGKGLKLSEIGMIAMVALATFAVLDIYAPSVGASARTGAGFGIGAKLVGFP